MSDTNILLLQQIPLKNTCESFACRRDGEACVWPSLPPRANGKAGYNTWALGRVREAPVPPELAEETLERRGSCEASLLFGSDGGSRPLTDSAAAGSALCSPAELGKQNWSSQLPKHTGLQRPRSWWVYACSQSHRLPGGARGNQAVQRDGCQGLAGTGCV